MTVIRMADKAEKQVRMGTRPEVAEYLGVAPKTLAEWASKGLGPRYYRLAGGAARYRWEDVDAWVATQETGGAA